MSRNTIYKFQMGKKEQKIIARELQMIVSGLPPVSVWPMN